MREKRIREKMLDSIQELVKSFVDENITMLKERKFGFLGHCSGSIVAYEAAKYAKEAYGIEPEIMFVSSCYAPDDYSAPALSSLDDEDLLNVIKDAGYVTQELLDNPFMFEYFAPIARKDFYIQENYSRDISLDDVSSQVNISPYYFSKIFKEETGENFIEYLTRVRIDKAKELLVDANVSVKEAGIQSGYSDPNYFSRIFKKSDGYDSK